MQKMSDRTLVRGPPHPFRLLGFPTRDSSPCPWLAAGCELTKTAGNSKKGERIMKRTRADHLAEWEGLLAALTARAAEVPQLDVSRRKLEQLANQFRDLLPRHKELTASKQELSLQLEQLTQEARQVATVLKVSLKDHFGRRNERLLEFGITPFRGFARKKGEPTAASRKTTAQSLTPPSNVSSSRTTPRGAGLRPAGFPSGAWHNSKSIRRLRQVRNEKGTALRGPRHLPISRRPRARGDLSRPSRGLLCRAVDGRGLCAPGPSTQGVRAPNGRRLTPSLPEPLSAEHECDNARAA